MTFNKDDFIKSKKHLKLSLIGFILSFLLLLVGGLRATKDVNETFNSGFSFIENISIVGLIFFFFVSFFYHDLSFKR